jgi:hypothetical protein
MYIYQTKSKEKSLAVKTFKRGLKLPTRKHATEGSPVEQLVDNIIFSVFVLVFRGYHNIKR